MSHQLAIYVQDTPIRRLAIETYTAGSPELDQPLIVELERSTNAESYKINYTWATQFDKNEWRFLNFGYGYLGNTIMKNGEVFSVFVKSCDRVGWIPNLENNQKDGRTCLVPVHHMQNAMFVSLMSNGYDNDPDLIRDKEDEEDEWLELDPDGYEMAINLEEHPKRRFSRDKVSSYDEFKELEFPYTRLRQLFKTQFFYFAKGVDISKCLQERYKTKNLSKFSKSILDWDEDFVWNTIMLKSLVQFAKTLDFKRITHLINSGLLLPIIQGYVSTFHPHQLSKPYIEDGLTATLISRVGWKRAGTRFHTRGLDDSGYVANFVETELQLLSRNYHFGYRVIRGSLPLFWKQEGSQLLGHKIQLSRSVEATQPFANLHLKNLEVKYGQLIIVNLLSHKELGPERPLSQRFEDVLAGYDSKKKIFYKAFDFHACCKGGNLNNAIQFVQGLIQGTSPDNYFLYDIEKSKVISNQGAVFRINCLDCLDRTNVIQGLILNYMIELYLKIDLHLNLTAGFEAFLLSQASQAISISGDHISKIYSGTGALQSGVITQGKGNILNKLSDATKSVSRLYAHHFLDSEKLATLEMVLDLNHQQIPIIWKHHHNSDECTPKSNEMHLTKFSGLKEAIPSSLFIHCGTYNVNGRYPSGSSLLPWLEPQQNGLLPDIYALVFEEIVELTPSQILSFDPERTHQWRHLLTRDLNKLVQQRDSSGDSYVLLCNEQLVGICIFIFVRKSLLHHIRFVMSNVKKTGLGGMAGNKGAAAIRLQIFDQSICFVGCHFASGQSKLEERNRDFWTIHQGLNFGRFGNVERHDVIFYIGDFNYRINLSHERVHNLVQRHNLSELLAYDQLNLSRRHQHSFPRFEESEIQFPPTYKYDVGTSIYDTSEKQRIPAWTDRILFRGDMIEAKYYDHAILFESDHRPVMAGFDVKIDSNRLLKKPTTMNADNDGIKVPTGTLIDLDESLLSVEGLPPPSSDIMKWWESPLDEVSLNEINLIDFDSSYNPFIVVQKSPDLYPPKLPIRPLNNDIKDGSSLLD